MIKRNLVLTISRRCSQPQKTYSSSLSLSSTKLVSSNSLSIENKNEPLIIKKNINTNAFKVDTSSSSGNTFHEKILIGYSRDQMRNLVFDVAKYKEFLPFCIGSEIITPAKFNVNKTIDKSLNLNLRLRNKKSSILNDDILVERPQGSREKNSFKARLEIGYPPIKEAYVSHVSMVTPYQITSISRDTNLFDYLINEWKFHSNGKSIGPNSNDDSCIVDFYVSFKFRSALYARFSEMFMDQVFGKMVEAFTNRARQLYGPPSRKTSKAN